MSDPRLSVAGLSVGFRTPEGFTWVVRDVDLTLGAGETLAVVGESGSGKSVASLALMRLLPAPPRARIEGSATLHGQGGDIDLLSLSEKRMRAIRGTRIAMIFQEPLTSLNPVHRIGTQIVEAIRAHSAASHKAARRRAVEMLDLVGIPRPAERLDTYPHELSGGMRQRVMIAIALALEPDILIADEPTTALDVTVQAQIIELMQELQKRNGMAIMFITHNFGVVAQTASRTMVMYSGRVVEEGLVAEVLSRPLMPYTQGLMQAVPRLDQAGGTGGPLGTVEGFVPDPAHLPSGCSFHPRCPHRRAGVCDTEVPPLESAGTGHRLRCLRWREIAEGRA